MESQVLDSSTHDNSASEQPPDRLLAVGGQKRGGLILCKLYHAEFAGPGALVASPVELDDTVVIAIGSPELVPVMSHEDRQRAYSSRIQWVRWLQKLVEHPDPHLRVEKLISSFDAFFGHQVVAGLPDEALALLVGVLPQTVQAVRRQQRNSGRRIDDEANQSGDRHKIVTINLNPSMMEKVSQPTNALLTHSVMLSAFVNNTFTLPCSA